MKKFNLAALTLALGGVMIAVLPINQAAATPAYGGTITFNGTIKSGTCKVEIGSSPDAIIDMGPITAQQLNDVGTGGSVSFVITASGCDPTIVGASTGDIFAYFNSSIKDNHEASTGNLKNKFVASAGLQPASNVEVEIKDIKNNHIWIGDATKQQASSQGYVQVKSSNIAMTYKANYIKTGLVTAGQFTSQVGYEIAYK